MSIRAPCRVGPVLLRPCGLLLALTLDSTTLRRRQLLSPGGGVGLSDHRLTSDTHAVAVVSRLDIHVRDVVHCCAMATAPFLSPCITTTDTPTDLSTA